MGRQLQFTSEKQIREEARKAFEAKRKALKSLADKDNEAAQKILEDTYDESKIEGPEFDAWVSQCVDHARTNGTLLTETQYQDYRHQRSLREGDKVRYIGPDRTETPSSGSVITRPTGQTGVITAVESTRYGDIVTFTPEVPAAQVDGEIVLLRTHNWRLFERLL